MVAHCLAAAAEVHAIGALSELLLLRNSLALATPKAQLLVSYLSPRVPHSDLCVHASQVPTWQVALPDKLLQFRPLDLLRADTFALAGLMALLAQVSHTWPLDVAVVLVVLPGLLWS